MSAVRPITARALGGSFFKKIITLNIAPRLRQAVHGARAHELGGGHADSDGRVQEPRLLPQLRAAALHHCHVRIKVREPITRTFHPAAISLS
jgi:hypothetical protein